MQDIASGDYSHQQLRDRYNYQNIRRFVAKYALEIEDIRKNNIAEVRKECAGLWIADRTMRIAQYQDIVDKIDKKIHDLAYTGSTYLPFQALKIKAEVLRLVAEELGQIPEKKRTAEEQGFLEYAVKGISTAELQGQLT